MKLSQFYFTTKLWKLKDEIVFIKNTGQYISKKLHVYYDWWGFQNFYNQKKTIDSAYIFSIQNDVFIYKI